MELRLLINWPWNGWLSWVIQVGPDWDISVKASENHTLYPLLLLSIFPFKICLCSTRQILYECLNIVFVSFTYFDLHINLLRNILFLRFTGVNARGLFFFRCCIVLQSVIRAQLVCPFLLLINLWVSSFLVLQTRLLRTFWNVPPDVWKFGEQCCPIELSVMVDMSYQNVCFPVDPH